MAGHEHEDSSPPGRTHSGRVDAAALQAPAPDVGVDRLHVDHAAVELLEGGAVLLIGEHAVQGYGVDLALEILAISRDVLVAEGPRPGSRWRVREPPAEWRSGEGRREWPEGRALRSWP